MKTLASIALCIKNVKKLIRDSMGSGVLVVARALLWCGAMIVAHHLHHQVGVHCGGDKGLTRHRDFLERRESVFDGSSLVSLATYRLSRINKQRQRKMAAELVGLLVKMLF